MTILSDFDGVLTNQIDEAMRVQEIARNSLCEATDLPASEVKALWEFAKQVVYLKPYQYGWMFSGRISAYCNEDLFIEGMGITQLLDELKNNSEHPVFADLKLQSGSLYNSLLTLVSKVEHFGTVSQLAYTAMTRETSAGMHKPLEASGAKSLKSWLHLGHQVVIVSNSETARIEEMLAREFLWPARNLKIMGGAKKFELGTTPDTIQQGKYLIERDRPRYLSILLEVKPNVVIGDVFSLDLALPLKLKSEGKIPLHYGMLMQRKYTPDWIQKEIVSKNESRIKTVTELPLDFVN